MNGTTDTLTVRLVVIILGIISLTSLAGVIWLLAEGIDAGKVALVTGPMNAAIGAVAAVLVSTRSGQTPPEVPAP